MVAYPVNADRVLLVEGQDDKHLVWQLCRRDDSLFSVTRSGYDMSVTLRHQSATFLIKEEGSRQNLIESIRGEVVSRQNRVVGILLDADDDLEKRWSEVVNGFSRTDIQSLLPPYPKPAGTIIPEKDDQPRVGIWLMPDNKSQGELEDFVLDMIPPSDTVKSISKRYIKKVIEYVPQSDRKFKPEKTDKARLYAWLATRREPARMGAAVGSGDLEIDRPVCRNLLDWLINLFG